MHVPLIVFAVYPGERWPQLGDKIVAARFIAVPPAAGDALGTGDEREPAFLHRDDPLQEPSRTRARLHKVVRIPFAGLDAAPGIFRPVVGIDADAVHRVASQAACSRSSSRAQSSASVARSP